MKNEKEKIVVEQPEINITQNQIIVSDGCDEQDGYELFSDACNFD